MKNLLTPEEVRAEFARRGVSIAEWARIRQFSTALVYQVLAGKRKGLRGQSHEIAIALGLKEGVSRNLSGFPFSENNDSLMQSDK